jgi:ATP-binding cassette subfamily B protein
MRSLKRLLVYAQNFRKEIVLASVYSVFNKVFDILPEILIGFAVDVVVNQKDSFIARLGIHDLLGQLVCLGAVTLIAFLCESILQYLFQLKWRYLAQSLQHQMRLDAYNHVQKLDFSFLESESTGRMLSVLNDDVNQLERFLDGGANALIQVVASSLLIGAIFFYISPLVAVIALLPMPLIVFAAYRFQEMLGPRYALVREKAGLISARLANNLSGMTTIRSFAAEDFENDHLSADSRAYQEANNKAIILSSAYIPLVRMAIVAGFIATLVLGGYLAVTGHLAIASYSVLVFLTQRLLWPFTRLAEMTDLYQRAMASADRVLDLLERKIEIKSGTKSVPHIAGRIEFQNVSFSYKNGNKVFDNFNLSIEQGQTVAIVGATGSGKSTLLKLLLRFYSPLAGTILIDGHNIADLKLNDLRKAIALVSQDIFLFSGTIHDNINYGTQSASFSSVVKAAQIAEAESFINKSKKGFDADVGERGQLLSHGQRQRICIARALVKDAPIFVLDEATSAVDNETEEAIQKSLARIVAGRTTIIIAHRLSTVRHADKIYVLENGKIAESGNHETLKNAQGIYARLWRIQTGALNDEA